jgi:hypothetical protein
MSGAISPLPNTSSWRGALLRTGTTLVLPQTFQHDCSWKNLQRLLASNDSVSMKNLVRTVHQQLHSFAMHPMHKFDK